jgi:3-hydroxyacyl-[acyl-carrier-protein] dehydratase
MFYEITNWQAQENMVKATIQLDANDPLFKGHFPNMPILPGACMVQLTHHMVNRQLGQTTRFVKAGAIKFLIPINPLTEPELLAQLKYTATENGLVKVEQSLSFGDKTYFKFSALYQTA